MNKVLESKTFWICLIIFFGTILLSGCLIFFSIKNNYKLNGSENVEIPYGQVYEDEGIKCKLFNKDYSKRVKVESNLDNSKVGNYQIDYSFKFLIFNFNLQRKIRIYDEEKPTIVLNGEQEMSICPMTEYEEEGYHASDSYDGDLTSEVLVFSEDDGITYKVSDTSGNEFSIKRKIVREDKEKPQISLIGNSSVYVRLNQIYKDKGYSVKDNCDKDVKVKMDSNVDTSKVGTYYVTYTATDESGNSSSVKRSVTVSNTAKGSIYLTFDDGPSGSGSTKKILDVLKKEGVKATFFVTGSGPDDLIVREYNEGHKIALHTNSHKYSEIYTSIEDYYVDLEKIKARVKRLTGESPKIIRFPGGSNNTVSNNYNKGIMDELTKDVIEKGYVYFDWNVSSGDAGGCSNSKCVYNNVVKGLSTKNNIVLMHDIKNFTADALEDIIQYGKENGYEFKVLTENTPVVKFK